MILIALVTGQRCQSIHLMDLTSMQKTNEKFRFIINKIIKTSGPGKRQPVLFLPKFTPNDKRCVYSYIEEYIDGTAILRGSQTGLFISIFKPHKVVTSSTISRWVKTGLGEAGIDTSVFAAHSTRSASSSAAKRASTPLSSILRAGTWASSSTFRLFYEKPIDNEDNFALAILK